ncbi:MAG TPA: DNRLRE domain-containing protein, partial [Patescibacteria group bacterium]|nr:DNRLRE domain-containing protein [Patescibacteria group bacterium]
MTISGRLSLVFAFVLTWKLAVQAATFNIAPSADTYFEAYGSENKNFGAEPVLRMDQWGGRQIFLRFPLQELPRQNQIASAVVRLYIVDTGFNEQGEFPDLKTCIGLYDVATGWTELGLTYMSPDGQTNWNQGPGIAEPKYTDVGPLPRPDAGVNLRIHAIALNANQVSNGMWLTLDITDFIRKRISAQDKEVNLLLRSSILGRNYIFRSREGKETEQQPRLVVETDDALPAWHLPDVFRTDWTPGQPVPIVLQSSRPFNAATAVGWSLASEPQVAGSRRTKLEQSADGAALRAEAPGKYQITCKVQPNTADR